MRRRTEKIVKTVAILFAVSFIAFIFYNLGANANQETEYIQDAIRNGMTCFSGCAKINCTSLKVINYDNCPTPEDLEKMEYYVNMSDNQTICHPEGDYQTGWGVDCGI